MSSRALILGIVCMASVLGLTASAALRSDKIHTAGSRKTNDFVEDGMVVGGDRAIDEVVVKDIRRAANAGFERFVIDLEGSRNGEPAVIPRPPYFQVAANQEEKRLVFTVWGKPRLAFDARKVTQAFKKSPAVESIELLPKLNEDHWTFTVNFKNAKAVEVFELTQPVRIILDIRNAKKPALSEEH